MSIDSLPSVGVWFFANGVYVLCLLVFAGGARGVNALGPEYLKSIFHCSVKRIYVVYVVRV